VIKFCVKLKNTPAETFEMLESVYSRTSVFEFRKGSKQGSGNVRNAKIEGKQNVLHCMHLDVTLCSWILHSAACIIRTFRTIPTLLRCTL
jgi:hypothetical protein